MKKYFIVLTLSLGLVLGPSSAYASNLLLLNGSDSIVPTVCRSCPCGVAGAFQFVQNIMNVMISIGVIFMIFFIVWAGFLFITSVANPESRSKARSMLINAFIGMIIVLAGWLIVDYIMKALNGGNDTTFGPWNKILQVSDPNGSCIVPKPSQPIAGLPGAGGVAVGGGAVGAPGGGNAVSSLPAQEAANKLLSSSNVTSTNSVSSCGSYAGATSNLQQAAAGNGMSRCPCGGGGSVAASPTLLNSMVDMANAGARFQINVIAGGCHSSGSNHYQGIAADIQRNSSLDAFFSKYPRVSCQGSKTGYQVSGEVVCFENSGHYHVSPSGN